MKLPLFYLFFLSLYASLDGLGASLNFLGQGLLGLLLFLFLCGSLFTYLLILCYFCFNEFVCDYPKLIGIFCSIKKILTFVTYKCISNTHAHTKPGKSGNSGWVMRTNCCDEKLFSISTECLGASYVEF